MLEGPTGLLDTQQENRGGCWENAIIIIIIYSHTQALEKKTALDIGKM